MASDATKSHSFQQLFSIKILTKLSYWVYIFLGNFLKIAKMPKKPFSLGARHPIYQICKKKLKKSIGKTGISKFKSKYM